MTTAKIFWLYQLTRKPLTPGTPAEDDTPEDVSSVGKGAVGMLLFACF